MVIRRCGYMSIWWQLLCYILMAQLHINWNQIFQVGISTSMLQQRTYNKFILILILGNISIIVKKIYTGHHSFKHIRSVIKPDWNRIEKHQCLALYQVLLSRFPTWNSSMYGYVLQMCYSMDRAPRSIRSGMDVSRPKFNYLQDGIKVMRKTSINITYNIIKLPLK